jgi:hypothetical protein
MTDQQKFALAYAKALKEKAEREREERERKSYR